MSFQLEGSNEFMRPSESKP